MAQGGRNSAEELERQIETMIQNTEEQRAEQQRRRRVQRAVEQLREVANMLERDLDEDEQIRIYMANLHAVPAPYVPPPYVPDTGMGNTREAFERWMATVEPGWGANRHIQPGDVLPNIPLHHLTTVTTPLTTTTTFSDAPGDCAKQSLWYQRVQDDVDTFECPICFDHLEGDLRLFEFCRCHARVCGECLANYHWSGASGIPSDELPHVKLALVGDPEVGKTCIMLRYLKNQFSPMYMPTKKAVIESAVKKINVPGHTVASLTIWDIPGREDVDLHKTYFRDLDAAIVVVDLTDTSSIEMAPVWKQIILNNTYTTHPVKEASHGGQVKTMTMEEHPVDRETFPVLLMGTKFDVIEQRVQAERLVRFAREEQTDEGDKRVWSIGDPLTEDEKPECIKMLEQLAVDHNFHGSMMVSARDGDGSVREAMQFLIRHVLENKYSMKKYKNREIKEKKKEKKKIELEGLEKIGVVKFDTVFISANTLVKKVATLREFYNKSLTKFKEGCQLAQIIEKRENSLEDCIMALRENIGEGAKLKVKKDEGFCKLEIDTKIEEFTPVKKIQILLNIFHKEYATVCKTILSDCPGIDSSLQDQEAELDTMCKESWHEVAMENNVPRSQEEIDKITDNIEKNRAKMRHASLEARAAQQTVDDAMKKIKAAFLW